MMSTMMLETCREV